MFLARKINFRLQLQHLNFCVNCTQSVKSSKQKTFSSESIENKGKMKSPLSAEAKEIIYYITEHMIHVAEGKFTPIMFGTPVGEIRKHIATAIGINEKQVAKIIYDGRKVLKDSHQYSQQDESHSATAYITSNEVNLDAQLHHSSSSSSPLILEHVPAEQIECETVVEDTEEMYDTEDQMHAEKPSFIGAFAEFASKASNPPVVNRLPTTVTSGIHVFKHGSNSFHDVGPPKQPLENQTQLFPERRKKHRSSKLDALDVDLIRTTIVEMQQAHGPMTIGRIFHVFQQDYGYTGDLRSFQKILRQLGFNFKRPQKRD